MSKIRQLGVSHTKLSFRRRVDDAIIGSMYFFYYDPKHKETLPYYDKFPLVFPIEMYNDGFLGLNLHYLDIGWRITLLDRLYTFRTSKNLNSSTQLKLSYGLIAETSKLSIAQPCIKRYLFSHVQSRFIPVFPEEWDMAALIPTNTFAKASNRQVWADSRKSF